MENYLPKIDPIYLCSALQLCSVRQRDHEYYVAVKKLDGTVSELSLQQFANADTYDGSPIMRSYASGHVFFSDDLQQVYLTQTEKHGNRQLQFTGWAPLEEANKDVVMNVDWEITFHLGKVEENALLRTAKRVWVDVLEHRNEKPLVDRVAIEMIDAEWVRLWRLVCLLHYIVKSYRGVLHPKVGVEDVIGGGWYDVADVLVHGNPEYAPNADIVVKKSLEIIQSI